MVDKGLNKLWYLKKINLLDGMEEKDLKFIDSKSRMKQFKKGETIYFSHSDVQQIFFLKKGKVKLYKTDVSGKEIVFAILKDRECFGSLSPLEVPTINEFAEAMEDTMVCVIDKNIFFSYIEDKPTIVLRLNKLLSLKIYELEMMLEELTFKTVLERAVSLFVKLNAKFGIQFNGYKMININLTHNDIAAMIGSTRESTTVALNTLKHQGLIDSRKKKIIIKDLSKLEKFKLGEG
jgi:CRP/FNR family transcriptional regulator